MERAKPDLVINLASFWGIGETHHNKFLDKIHEKYCFIIKLRTDMIGTNTPNCSPYSLRYEICNFRLRYRSIYEFGWRSNLLSTLNFF